MAKTKRSTSAPVGLPEPCAEDHILLCVPALHKSLLSRVEKNMHSILLSLDKVMPEEATDLCFGVLSDWIDTSGAFYRNPDAYRDTLYKTIAANTGASSHQITAALSTCPQLLSPQPAVYQTMTKSRLSHWFSKPFSKKKGTVAPSTKHVSTHPTCDFASSLASTFDSSLTAASDVSDGTQSPICPSPETKESRSTVVAKPVRETFSQMFLSIKKRLRISGKRAKTTSTNTSSINGMDGESATSDSASIHKGAANTQEDTASCDNASQDNTSPSILDTMSSGKCESMETVSIATQLEDHSVKPVTAQPEVHFVRPITKGTYLTRKPTKCIIKSKLSSLDQKHSSAPPVARNSASVPDIATTGFGSSSTCTNIVLRDDQIAQQAENELLLYQAAEEHHLDDPSSRDDRLSQLAEDELLLHQAAEEHHFADLPQRDSSLSQLAEDELLLHQAAEEHHLNDLSTTGLYAYGGYHRTSFAKSNENDGFAPFLQQLDNNRREFGALAPLGDNSSWAERHVLYTAPSYPTHTMVTSSRTDGDVKYLEPLPFINAGLGRSSQAKRNSNSVEETLYTRSMSSNSFVFQWQQKFHVEYQDRCRIEATLQSVALALYDIITFNHAMNYFTYDSVFTSHPMMTSADHDCTKELFQNVPYTNWKEIYEHMHFVFDCGELKAEHAIITLIYIERMLEKSKQHLCDASWRLVVLAGMLLAVKVWDDYAVYNGDFVHLFPEFHPEKLNKLERVFLRAMDWEIGVSCTVFATQYLQLQRPGVWPPR